MKEVAAAYLAGLIDGEGTVTLRKETRFRFPIVAVATTSRELAEWCVSNTNVGTISTKRLYSPHHKKSYHWVVRHHAAIRVLESVFPYLVEAEKKRRAGLIIEAYPNLTKRNGKYTKREAEQKLNFEKDFFRNSTKI